MSENPHALAHAVTALLAALIRSALLADRVATEARHDAVAAHARVRSELEALGVDHDRQLAALKPDGLWLLAKRQADMSELDRHPLQVSRQLTTSCPLGLGDLVGPSLATPALEERIRRSAATG